MIQKRPHERAERAAGAVRMLVGKEDEEGKWADSREGVAFIQLSSSDGPVHARCPIRGTAELRRADRTTKITI